jgi:hypothetical protein
MLRPQLPRLLGGLILTWIFQALRVDGKAVNKLSVISIGVLYNSI